MFQKPEVSELLPTKLFSGRPAVSIPKLVIANPKPPLLCIINPVPKPASNPPDLNPRAAPGGMLRRNPVFFSSLSVFLSLFVLAYTNTGFLLPSLSLAADPIGFGDSQTVVNKGDLKMDDGNVENEQNIIYYIQ
jgi:hypothetical protein